MSQNGALSAKQSALLAALLAGVTVESAAKQANISRRTATRWQKEPAFLAALDKAQDEVFTEKLKLLRSGVGAALACLARNMHESKPAAVQIRAAIVWLDAAIEVHKTAQLERQWREYELRLAYPGLGWEEYSNEQN